MSRATVKRAVAGALSVGLLGGLGLGIAPGAMAAGEDITFENVRLVLEAGGIKAVDADGSALGSHQAFWFAWSQFHPGTVLW